MSAWARLPSWWSFSGVQLLDVSWKSLAMLGPGCSWTLSGLGML